MFENTERTKIMTISKQWQIKKYWSAPLAIAGIFVTLSACGIDPSVSKLASSRVTKIAVDYTCEETSEATKWLEVGLRLKDSSGTVEAIVVEHNDDASPNNKIPSPLLMKRELTKFTLDRGDKKNLKSLFVGPTVKLAFDKSMSGELSIIADGPGSRNNSKIDCFKNTDGTPRFIKFVSKN